MTAYDEDLNENKFFVELRCNYWNVLQTAISSGCAVCVPCQSSVRDLEITEEDVLSNILIPVSNNVGSREFRSLAGRSVLKDGSSIYVTATGDGHSRVRAGIRFHEEFHGENGQKYDVWCVTRSLRDRGLECDPESDEETFLASLSSVHDCIVFLKKNVNAKVLAKIEYSIHKTLKSFVDVTSEVVMSLKIDAVFQEAVTAVGNVGSWSQNVIYLALESYILRDAQRTIVQALKRIKAPEDAQFNKRRRALTVRPDFASEFHVRSEFLPLLPKVRRELDRVPSCRTPAEKLEVLNRIMKIVADHANDFGILTTTDDFLPVLICALAQSTHPSWHAELAFLQYFRLARNDCDEKAYYIASLEAAIEHLKSTKPHNSWMTPSFKDPLHDTYRSHAEKLWVAVQSNDCAAIDAIAVEMRRSGARLGARLCHPLCSCLECVEIKRLETDVAGGLVNCPDDVGRTPLHAAANAGHPKVIEHLVARGAHVNAADCDEYRTPLHVAAMSGHTDAVLLLLYAGADVNLRDAHGRTCLHLASGAGHKNCVNALLYFAAHSGLDLNAGDAHGDTALHLAVAWGYHEIVAALLEHRANPLKKNYRGLTPISVAANPVVSDLLEANLGDRIGTYEKIGSPYLFSAKAESKWSSLFVRKAKARGESVDAVDPRVEKCFRAITLGDIRLACYYLGIDPFASFSCAPSSNRRNKCHPLCSCPSCSAEADSDILLVDCRNADGYTPLHMAALHNRIEIVKALLVNDADPNRTTTRGMTPLHLACQCNLVDVAKMLLAFQADLSVRDDSGNSALHYACILGNVELARILLAFGAADAGVNTNKRTPSMEAKERRFIDVLRLFAHA